MSCFIKSLFLKHEYFNSEPNKYNVISCEGGTCMNDNNNYYNMPCNQAELPNYLKCSLPCSSIPTTTKHNITDEEYIYLLKNRYLATVNEILNR